MVTESYGNVSKQDGFGEWASVVKAVGGLFAGDASINEAVVVVQAFQEFYFFGVVGFRVESWGADMWEYHGAFGSVKKGAGAGESCCFGDMCASCAGASAAIEPGDGESVVGT